LATAITILPLEDPLRLAEDVSVVDTISGGRVEIGVGSGASKIEYAAFGRDIERKRELTTEGLAVLTKALAGEEVGAAGFRIQPPPGEFSDRIWQGVFSAGGAQYAAGVRLEPAPEPRRLRLQRAYRRGTAPLGRCVPRGVVAAAASAHRAVALRLPAKDRKTALDIIGADVLGAARRIGSELGFPADLDTDEAAAPLPLLLRPPRRDHRGVAEREGATGGHRPHYAVQPRGRRPRQRHPSPLELIATEIAPTLGWKPARQAGPSLTGARP